MKSLVVLGSTGSIGVTTLDLVARFPDRFRAAALAAGRNVERLAEQVRRFQPDAVATADAAGAESLRALVPEYRGEILSGIEGIAQLATAPGADLVISALVGAIGLRPTLAAIEAGRDVALANKEVLVVAGELVQAAARRRGVHVFPIDSEHNAIYQAMHGHRPGDVKRIILTASGGPFLRASMDELRRATPAQALKHPTWKMGAKITIDSASLMNKGLEVIEAHWLFDMPYEQIDVVVHPESIIHSIVEYADGGQIAQLGLPDMRTPIQYALSYPDRLPRAGDRLRLEQRGALHFLLPDLVRFPCLQLARDAGIAGGTYPTVLSAADDVVVAAFLDSRIGFMDIPAVIADVATRHTPASSLTTEAILDADAWARSAAATLVRKQARS